jgi:Protein of unknown function (DUF4435)
MSEIPRFTIEDLHARYDLEPSLNDLYVEGTFDKEILERLFTLSGCPHRVIYEINAIDIPPTVVKSHNLTEGNKQRVITLARELAKVKRQAKYKCLVDRDLDHWFGPLEKTRNLAWTEHTSIELYYFSEDFLKDVILVTARSKISNWNKYFQSFVSTLKLLYAMRLADRSLGYSMKWVSTDKSLRAQGNEVIFNHENYIEKVLINNKQAKNNKIYRTEFLRCLDMLSHDPRSHIRGHDMVAMISWSVNAFKGQKEYASDVAIERLFVLLSDRAKDVLRVLN